MLLDINILVNLIILASFIFYYTVAYINIKNHFLLFDLVIGQL